MKYCILIIFLVTVLNAQFNNSEHIADLNPGNISFVSSSFTDSCRYNILAHARNPLGLFEYTNAIVSMHLGYRHFGYTSDDESLKSHGVIAPHLIIGKPGIIYLDLFYTVKPTIWKIKKNDDLTYAKKMDKFVMPLNNFGLGLIAQTKDERFAFGLKGAGFVRRLRKESTEDTNRIAMGVDEIGLCMSSKLHDAVGLAFYAHSEGYFDSINVETDKKTGDALERFGYLMLPQIDVAIDIGMDDLPYMSNFCFSYARKHFVYSVLHADDEFHKIAGTNTKPDNADPIVTDSIGWHWQNLWMARIQELFSMQPALELGFWHGRHKRMKPGSDNEPLNSNYVGEKKGFTWDTKAFTFGPGLTLCFGENARIWFEYARQILSIEVTGDSILKRLSDEEIEIPEKEAYDRIGCGLEMNIHKFSSLSMPSSVELFFKLGFLLIYDNELADTYRSKSSKYMNTMKVNTQLDRYQPWEVMRNEIKTINATFDVGASFSDKIFSTCLHFGIIHREKTYISEDESGGSPQEYKGFEFGLEFTYNRLE